MIQLSEQQKQIFETNVEQITSKDVQNVLDNIDQELKNLQRRFNQQMQHFGL